MFGISYMLPNYGLPDAGKYTQVTTSLELPRFLRQHFGTDVPLQDSSATPMFSNLSQFLTDNFNCTF